MDIARQVHIAFFTVSYEIFSFQANEFKEKKEKALRQIEDLSNLDKSPDMKEKQQVSIA